MSESPVEAPQPIALPTSGTEIGNQIRPATPEGALDFMWQAFSNLNEWVRFSDTKAGAVLAVDGVIVGAIATVAAGSKPDGLETPVALLWMLAVVFASACSALNAIGSLLPQLRIGPQAPPLPKAAAALEDSPSEESSSLVFFMDIDAKFPTAREFHASISAALNHPEQAVRQISHQVWANSKVAAVKYARVTLAIENLLAAVILGALGVIVLLISQLVGATNGK